MLIVIAIIAVFYLDFVLIIQVLIQHQQLKQEVSQAIADKLRAVGRYRQLRNRFIRRKKCYWKCPGRTEKWWRNFLDGTMLPDEWIQNFRMSKDDFMALESLLHVYI